MRRATAADVGAVARFQTEVWRETYAGLVPGSYLDRVGVAEREVRWRERIGGTRSVALAESPGRLLGVVSWRATSGADLPPLELTSLYVGAGARGSGLGSRLLAYALGRRPAYLWVFEANARAQAFYARLGFATDGATALDEDTGLRELRMVRGAQGTRPA